MTFREIICAALGFAPPALTPLTQDDQLPAGQPSVAMLSPEELAATRAKAAGGEAQAQLTLAMLYYRGMGVRLNLPEALKWLTLAAEQGDPKALNYYSIIIQGLEPDDIAEGRDLIAEFTGPRNIVIPDLLPVPELDPHSLAATGIERAPLTDFDEEDDPDVASDRRLQRAVPVARVQLTTMAVVAGVAAAGSPRPAPGSRLVWGILGVAVAMGLLASVWLLSGLEQKPELTPRDQVPNMEQRAAATKAQVPSFPRLPNLPKDVASSVDLSNIAEIKAAALEGNPSAQFRLGLAYDTGQGVPQDYATAFKWYVKAAEQGDAGAQNNLAVMYVRGTGVATNLVEAYRWFHLASRASKGSAQNRDQLALYLSADQLAEALRLARATGKR